LEGEHPKNTSTLDTTFIEEAFFSFALGWPLARYIAKKSALGTELVISSIV
jgi:hypothetical protein